MTNHVNRKDIQGIIASGYDHLSYARFVFLKIADPDAARKWLSDIVALITTAQYPETHKPGACLHFAVSWKGLDTLGVASLLQDCPHEFSRGMDGDGAPGSWVIRDTAIRTIGNTAEQGASPCTSCFCSMGKLIKSSTHYIKMSAVRIKVCVVRPDLRACRSSRNKIRSARKMITGSPSASATAFLRPP